MNLSTQFPGPAALSVTGLGKAFGDTVVLDGIDLDVPAGTVFALLGPNGAGRLGNCQLRRQVAGWLAARPARTPPARSPGT